MELRIVQFNESRAKQFIWQEDQKTKMRKVDSEAMNQTVIPTKVITRLNLGSCLAAGQINPNDALINSSDLFLCINSLYGNKVKKSEELAKIIEISGSLQHVIDYVISHDVETYGKHWDRRRVIAVTYVCYLKVPDDQILKEIEIYYKIMNDNIKLFLSTDRQKFSKRDYTRLDKIKQEVSENV
jgi:hypothetical protein